MKKTVFFTWVLSIGVSISIMWLLHKPITVGVEPESGAAKTEESAAKQEWLFMMLRDPATNRIPNGIHRLEQKFAAELNSKNKAVFNKNSLSQSVQSLVWGPQGPFNLGGRACAIKMDVTDTNILIVGTSTGGILRTTDRGTSWTQCLDNNQMQNVYCLAQDTRIGKRNIWYAGTGEVGSPGAGAKASVYKGDGIYKSTDGGLTWNLLPSTISNTPQTIDRFDLVFNIAVDVSNNAQDIVYAATSNGIERSSDGGSTWTLVLPGIAGTNSDVAVAPNNGSVYAIYYMNHVWRSSNGIDWVQISPDASFGWTHLRGAIAICPSNPNSVYFLLSNTAVTPNRNSIQFWKYTYLSGSGQGSGGNWVNLSDNLPVNNIFSGAEYPSGFLVNLNTGTESFLKIVVKPDDENFVILCTTNLNRSTNGFQDVSGNSHLGGYDPAVTFHPVLHCDIFDGVFNPQNPRVFYSANDGGVTRTEDIRTNYSASQPVDWISCSGGLGNTQPYSVSMDPDGGTIILSGLQDQGGYSMNTSLVQDWTYITSGDGTGVKVGPELQDRLYIALQSNYMQRAKRNRTQVLNMAPAEATNQVFANPFALDPHNQWYLYYGGGNASNATGIWRNLDAPNATSTNGWVYLNGSGFDDATQRVTAIGVSKSMTPHTVYYGTSKGKVKRIYYANSESYEITDVTNNLPANGFISSISVDPESSDKVLATYSNYNFQSIWYSTDAGNTWYDVETNLAGATGPSVNNSIIFYLGGKQHIFVGTSTGLYFNPNITPGAKSISNWEQIGTNSRFQNLPVSSMDFRNVDNKMAISAVGAGIFTTYLNEPLPVEMSSFSGRFSNGKVILKWQTKTELNNNGFMVQRNYRGIWEDVKYIQGHGNSSTPHDYSFADAISFFNNIKSRKYRLKQIDNDGTCSYSAVIEIATTDIPRLFTLSQNYPNPFNPLTNIEYGITEDTDVSFQVFTSNGSLQKNLPQGRQKAGYHRIEFDGSRLASGIYYYRLTAGKYSQTKKMIVLK